MKGKKSQNIYKTKVDKIQDRKIAKLTRIVDSRERKFFDAQQSTIVPSWNGLVPVSLIAPAQGDADNQRAGDDILLESLDLKWVFYTTNTLNNNLVRLVIFFDKSNTIDTAGKLYKVTGTQTSILAPLNEDYRANYTLVLDKVFTISADKEMAYLSIKKAFKKAVTFVQGTTTASLNNLKFSVIGDLAAPTVAYDYYARIKYSDV